MRGYDNFSPEIYEYEESVTPVAEAEEMKPFPDMSEKSDKKTSRSHVVKPEKKPKTKTKAKKTASSASSEQSLTLKERINQIAELPNLKTLKLLWGVFLGCFGAYLLVAFISYLTDCLADASEVTTMAVGYGHGIENKAGEGGARLAHFLINDTFGLGSVVIILWLGAMSLKMLIGKPHFKTVNFTIKCLVALLTVSLIVGLSTIALNSPANWGGFHGREVNNFIISFTGWYGAALLCVFMVAAFVGICLSDLIRWIMKKRRERAEKKAAEEALLEEQRQREAELNADLEREENDARAAGEAPDFSDEIEDDSVVKFDGEVDDDLPEYIYEDDADNYVIPDDTPAENADEIGKNDDDADDSDNPDGAELSEEELPENPDETEDFAESEEADDDVMVVNRNTIGQTSDKRLKSENSGPKYKLPPFDILREFDQTIAVNADEQQANKDLIRKTLLDFKIPIQSIEATVGPTVTLYEIVPAAGVKISRICSLVPDIKLSLSATGVRIIAPIPGRGTVGIEVANKHRQIVSMRSVLQSKKFAECTYRLPIALGATISNDVFITDLAKMPHLLVAGATGQGKSVCLNAIIASLLYRKRPDELKFVMVDPKMVEFSIYNKIESHYLAKLPDADEAIITKMDDVIPTLLSLCVEMDSRYELLKAAHCRNLEEYNAKIHEHTLNPADGHRFLPYIVVIVDEFADLIMTAGKEVEKPIARLAQKARAVGMHVILATQRPSVKVITGMIKANFPARIAFRTTSGVDSKTILDKVGSEELIGMGDMLITNNSDLVRVQCAFIDTPEVEELCDYVERQPFNDNCYILPEPQMQNESETGGLGSDSMGEIDPLLPEAARVMINANVASTSSLQRRFSIGYNRAGKIMDQLEDMGVVGPSHGGKPRSILVDPGSLETILQAHGV